MITWDERKRQKVIKDHSVDIAKIEDILDDPFAIDYEDDEHSIEEDRRVHRKDGDVWTCCNNLCCPRREYTLRYGP